MDEERVLYLDTETFSETPIRNGTHRYAEGVEILIAAWALDEPLFGIEGEIIVEDLTDEHGIGRLKLSDDLIVAMVEADRIVIHQSAFDRTVLRHALGIHIPLDKIECTMVRAMAHGLPGGLEKLSEIFKLGDDAKHQGGKELIRLFCMPAPKNSKIRRRTKLTHPGEWQTFLAYAGGDIRSMRALRKKLPWWNYPGVTNHDMFGEHRSPEYEAWLLDQKINDRGFKVDLDLARSAIEMFARTKKINDDYVEETTYGEVTSANQRDKLLEHLLGWYGVSLPDLTKSTIERRLDDPDLPEVVKELLRARQDTTVTSIAKYNALERSVSKDGRLRGTTQFCGAVRTGRSAGRIFQPTNLIRPNKAEAKAVAGWIEDIKSGMGELLIARPERAAAVSLRGAIIADKGKKLVVADLANIEGRVLAWLAGERWKLKAYAEFDLGIGHDLYKIGAGRILNKDPAAVTEDERQVLGKVPELALGFQGAAGAFGTMSALYGLNLETDRVDQIVRLWRDTNAFIKQLWYDLEEAAREAVARPGHTFYAGDGDKIAFHQTGEWLLMQLPSGRKLCYCSPAIVAHPKFDNATSLSYLGVNSYTRRWERIHTYGGKLAENATQAVARDVLWANMPAIEQTGFPIVLHVYDEVVTEPDDDPVFTTERLCALLSATPMWADAELPLAAGGFEAYRYRKD